MDNAEIKLCGLCFTEICDNNYKIISKNDRFMLDMLFIKLVIVLMGFKYNFTINRCFRIWIWRTQ